MAETHSRRPGEFCHAPVPRRIAQHDPQHLRRFRLEDRLDLAPLRRGPGRNQPLDKYPVEDQPAVALKIEVAGVVLPAQLLRFRREKGSDQDGRGVLVFLVDIRPQLQQGFPDVARLAVGLDLADKNVAPAADAQARQDIDMVSVPGRLGFDALDVDRGDLRQKLFQGLHRLDLNLFH